MVGVVRTIACIGGVGAREEDGRKEGRSTRMRCEEGAVIRV